MSNTPVVVAILLNYHKKKMTIECARSLSSQVSQILIVDHSEDETEVRELRHFLRILVSKNQHLSGQVLVPAANLGFGGGINYALDFLRNSGFDFDSLDHYVLLINNDCIAGKNLVSDLISAIDQEDSLCYSFPRTTIDREPLFWYYHKCSALLLRRALPGSFMYPIGACLLFPTKLLSFPLFSSKYFMYGEDVELCWRLRKKGIKPVSVSTELTHLGSISASKGSLFYEYHVLKGHWLLASDLADSRLSALLHYSCRSVFLTARVLLRALKQRSTIPIQAAFRLCLGSAPKPPKPTKKSN